jgi:hypothetical protein
MCRDRDGRPEGGRSTHFFSKSLSKAQIAGNAEIRSNSNFRSFRNSRGTGICKSRTGRMPATPGGDMSELVGIAAAPYEQKLPCR